MTDLELRGPVFLTGMMGAGKSTVGQLLAQRLGVAFIDLDQRVERIAGCRVAELFAVGEAEFRRREHAALRSLVAEPGFRDAGSVVATGGGVVEDVRNRELMLSCGRVAYLAVSIDVLLRRLSSPEQLAVRPLLDARSLRTSVAARLAQREPLYKTAQMCIDASDDAPIVVARLLAELSCTSNHSPKDPG